MSENLILFFGRLHPLLVHLPIGILILAVCLHFLGCRPAFNTIGPVLPILWFAGSVSAVLACLAGFLLQLSGDYEADAVTTHQYLGIALAVFSVLLFLLPRYLAIKPLQTPAVLILLFLLTATGHYGSSLTHGED